MNQRVLGLESEQIMYICTVPTMIEYIIYTCYKLIQYHLIDALFIISDFQIDSTVMNKKNKTKSTQ